MKINLLLTLLFIPSLSFGNVDQIDWSVLETKWRKPLCLTESVYPVTSKRASSLAKIKESQVKQKYNVKRLASMAYRKTSPEPEVLDSLREIVLLKAFEVARKETRKHSSIKALKKYAKAAYAVCTRLLNRHPATRCHDFLKIAIKPTAFVSLVGSHFDTYQNSAIYALDMRGQCRVGGEPDWSCGELAKDYFTKNHLESCVAGQLEPPEKLEPIADYTPPVNSN